MTVSRTICLGFLAVISVGTILLMLPFSITEWSWSDFLSNLVTTLFTSTSAVCVTGLVVVDTGTFYSGFGQFIIALLIQVGGLGYMTATSFLLLLLGRRFKLRDKVAIQQSLDKSGMSGVLQLVRSIIATTLIFELSGAFLMMLVFMPKYGSIQGIWFSVFHSISAFNNAGFGLLADNLMQYVHSPLINLTITGLIIFGGLGYQVILELFLWGRDRFKKSCVCVVFSLNFKIVTSTTFFLLILGTIAFFLQEFENQNTIGSFSFGEKIMVSWFQSVTTRTAGFNTIDIGKMTTAGLFITIALMFIGASPGSTGGGIKTTTVRVLFNTTKAVLQGRNQVLCYQRQIPIDLILKAVGVVFGSMMTVISGTILIAMSDPKVEFIQILFEVVSAFATVGLSTGITASISTFAKLVLIVIMYVGRVGVLLLMSALLGDPSPTSIRYPEEELLVG